MQQHEQPGASEGLLGRQAIHESWESRYLNPDLDPFYDLAYAKLVERLGAVPGNRVLDVGCGYGYHAMRLARHGLRVTGVDVSRVALEHARRNVEGSPVERAITLVHGDLLRLPFHDDSFDFVNCWGVLMHVPELERALGELCRVLAPGGRLAITDNSATSWHVRVWEPAVRTAKRILGREVAARRRTVRGIEEWQWQEGGWLLVRKTRPGLLERLGADLGMTLVDRLPGQFTEMYTALPGRFLKRQVLRFNELWLTRVGRPGGALGNTWIFEKGARSGGAAFPVQAAGGYDEGEDAQEGEREHRDPRGGVG
ncbi:MAG: class I SAM-dependent methyltransferase [Myxococcota bacterium]